MSTLTVIEIKIVIHIFLFLGVKLNRLFLIMIELHNRQLMRECLALALADALGPQERSVHIACHVINTCE